MNRTFPRALAALLCMAALPGLADPLGIATPRGARVEAIADFPAGPGPFPAVVLAPGQAYPMDMPALAQPARRLVELGIAVYRFDWAYSTRTPRGEPSADLSLELEDLAAVVAAARADPRVDRGKLAVGGKSLGSLVAWRAFSADQSLMGGLFLTPLCSRAAPGQPTPAPVAERNYPGFSAERRPMAFILGDHDPLCNPSVLYRFAAHAAGPVRIAVTGGDHLFENRLLQGAAADRARERNIQAVARFAAGFIADAAAE